MLSGISFIVPTVGRPELAATLASIVCREGDEILVVGAVEAKTEGHVRYLPCPPGNDWGFAERNYATPFARGRYLAHIDDDDTYADGAREAQAAALAQTPDRPVIFKMRYPNGFTLWQYPEIRRGQVGTPMMLIPNVPEKLGTWGNSERDYCGDFLFLASMKWAPAEIVWRPEVIALIGRNQNEG